MKYRSAALLSALLCLMVSRFADATILRASSNESDATRASNAADGNFATRWSSVFSDDEWIELDFGSSRPMVGATLFWESAYGSAYDVLISDDGTNWITAYRERNGDGAVDDIYFGRRDARYLRIAGVKRATAWGYSLWEVVVRGPEAEIKVTVSSAASGGSESLFDGDGATAWRPAPEDEAPWVELSAADGLSGAGMDLEWAETPEGLVIETSSDGKEWAMIQECPKTAETMRCPVALAGTPLLRLSWKGQGALAGIKLRSWDEVTAKGGLDIIRGIVGAENHEWVTFVGRDGTFAPEPQPFQAGFWLSIGDALHPPEMLETEWTLREGRLPISEVAWSAGALRVKQTTFARYVEPLARLVTFARITVENTGADVVEAGLHALVRANPLAGKWDKKLSTLALDAGGNVSVNGSPAFFALAPRVTNSPAEAAVCRAAGVVSLDEGATVEVDAEQRGGALSFDCSLAPGESRAFDFLALAGESGAVDAASVRALSFDGELAAAEAFWRGRVPMRVEVPDKEYADAFYASLHYMLIMMKGSALHPGPYHYKSWFLHDAVEMNSALDNAGLHDVAKRVTERFNFQQGGGYLDELGGSVYALYEHARMAGDWDFLAQVYPRMLAGCKQIRELRRGQMGPDFKGSPIYGLLPKSVSQDNFTIPAHLYVDNWWAILALRSGALAASRLGHAEDEKWMQAECESLLRDTVSSIRQVMAKENLDVMPAFADYWPPEKRVMDAEHRILGDTQMAWAHRAPLFPGRTLGIQVPMELFRDAYRKYWERSGRFSDYDGGWFVEYEKLFWGYNVQLAIPMMYLGMEDVTLKNLEWSMRHQSCPGGWAEGYLTAEDANGLRRVAPGPIVGDVPHGWTAAYYVLLLRNMLMREERGALQLLPCIPGDWLAPGRRVAVENAPTYYGTVSWSVERVSESEIAFGATAERPPPRGYLLSLPVGLRIEGAESDAGAEARVSDNHVLLPAETRRATIRIAGP